MQELPRNALVGVYVRCSTKEQENSIPDQMETLDYELVKPLGLEVVKVYVSQGESGGTLEERQEIHEILRAAEKKLFKFLVVYDISRLTRGGNTDFWWFVRELKERGVLLYSFEHRTVATEEEAGQFCNDASQARAHNRKMAREVTRTMVQNVTTRNCDPGRRAPFGYDRLYITAEGEPFQRVRLLPDGNKQILDPKSLNVRMTVPAGERINKIKSHRVLLTPAAPSEVALVRRMFELAKSMSPTLIADTLNREGTIGPTGQHWCATAIRAILTNYAYIGWRVYNRRQESRYFRISRGRATPLAFLEEGKLNLRDNPREEWFVTERAHEPLVSEDLFFAVQEAMERRRKSALGTPRSKRRDYLLSGMMVCKRCGNPLTGQTKTASKAKGSKVYPVYACSGAKKYGKSQCACYSFPADRIEGFVLSTVRRVLAAPSALDALREGIGREFKGMGGRVRTEEECGRQLEELKRKKDKLFSVLDPDRMEFFRKQIDELQEEETRLNRLLKAAKAHDEAADPKAMVARGVHAYRETVAALKGEVSSTLRDVFRALGVGLVYDPDRKEGRLTFHPFEQRASRKAQPPAAA